jgi:hypothetical protein
MHANVDGTLLAQMNMDRVHSCVSLQRPGLPKQEQHHPPGATASIYDTVAPAVAVSHLKEYTANSVTGRCVRTPVQVGTKDTCQLVDLRVYGWGQRLRLALLRSERQQLQGKSRGKTAANAYTLQTSGVCVHQFMSVLPGCRLQDSRYG